MATMRNGLETWLKQECVNIADDLASISRLASAASMTSFNGDDRTTKSLINDVAIRLETMASGVISDDDRRIIGNMIDDAEKEYNQSNNMANISSIAHKLMIEKTVECQCGNGTSTMHGVMVHPEVANVGPCRCTPDKKFCFSRGIVGTLNDEQKEKYCQNPELL